MSCVITLSENLSYVKLSCLWAVDCLLLLFECFFAKGSVQHSKHKSIVILFVHMEVAFLHVGEKTDK